MKPPMQSEAGGYVQLPEGAAAPKLVAGRSCSKFTRITTQYSSRILSKARMIPGSSWGWSATSTGSVTPSRVIVKRPATNRAVTPALLALRILTIVGHPLVLLSMQPLGRDADRRLWARGLMPGPLGPVCRVCGVAGFGRDHWRLGKAKYSANGVDGKSCNPGLVVGSSPVSDGTPGPGAWWLSTLRLDAMSGGR